MGKTTLLSQLTPKTLICDFEERDDTNVRRLSFPSASVEAIESGTPDPWKEFKSIAEEANDSEDVDLLAIDSVDLAGQACLTSICADEGIRHPGEVNDYGATWNLIKSEFRSTFEAIRKSPTLGLAFSSHCIQDRMAVNTAERDKLKRLTVYTPSCTGWVKDYIQQSCAFVIFYGKHQTSRALHFRWEENIWTALSNDSVFRDTDGRPIAALEVPSAKTAGQTIQDAFNNNPSTLVLQYWEDEEPEETPKRRNTKKKFKKTA